MENKSNIFAGLEEVIIDAKKRMVIASPFRDVLDNLNQKELYLNKHRIKIIKYPTILYNVLTLRTSLDDPIENDMKEEELIREYSAAKLEPDKQGRILIPEEYLRHIRKNKQKQSPIRVVQSGGRELIYIWNAEDFRELEAKGFGCHK